MTLKSKLAAQMYSVRLEFEKDCEGTLRRLKDIGFEAIQLDGMRGNDPEKVAELIRKYDLKVAGMHIKHDRFFNDLDNVLYEAYLFQCKTIYDKYIDDEDQHEEGYKKTKKKLLEVARDLSPLGFRVGVHNPEYDYNNQVNGRKLLDYLTDPVDGICIYSEPDTYWMTVAGENPVETLKKYSGRAPILHLKDYKEGFESDDMDNNLVEVGLGDVNMEEVIQWGEWNGVEFYCIEQDYSKIGIFESLKQGFEHILHLGNKIKS
ncbi:sugar phosphate isomerase/epimerase family protein [Virgibacillus necropolis]|uniref:Sugar phosphate isomerase n=1 Tax=Virgibacillus necropolis TaxID=163877 RepID=A0A221M9J9_9BACI|nr:TIM barrel protein [Virgibacillus necropolis]ASN04324.1 sugar phosphate isomerase [Virgibacillus necropolis]